MAFLFFYFILFWIIYSEIKGQQANVIFGQVERRFHGHELNHQLLPSIYMLVPNKMKNIILTFHLLYSILKLTIGCHIFLETGVRSQVRSFQG